ncbi:MAG TPA: peptidylprolyl isomerase [Vicinamibacterales bacterium]|nr:peptidylprolyl isomerase [Vicinamibacterales bacterium]
MKSWRFVCVALLVLTMPVHADQRGAKPTAKPSSGPQFFTTPLTLDQMKGKQAVLETDLGTIVVDLLSEAAPNHVGYFIKNVGEGLYNGTVFHRVIRQGIIQGGDPLTRDPSKIESYGTGGFGVLRAERNSEKNTRGAVSAVVGGGDPDSGGTQFFICIADQPGLDGVYDVFGRVNEGILVAQRISEAATDERGRPKERVAIRSVTIRDKPAAMPAAFSTESSAELGAYRAVIETSMGDLTLELMPDKAPEHVRNFLRLAQAGVYNGMAFHRVAKGFVIQTGYLPSRREPLSEAQQRLVRNLQPEFNDTPHVKGIVSMARGDDPASADTSFFIVLGPSPVLDGKYTAFGRIIDGLSVVEAIEQVPVTGEAPQTRIEVKHVRVEKRP